MVSGIYLHDGFVFEPKENCPFYWDLSRWRAYVDQLAGMGIEVMEFCTQAAFLRIPSTDFERRRIETMGEVIRYAHEKGMKVWQIVSSNVLSGVPDGELPVDQREKSAFLEPCPREPGVMDRLREVTEYFVSAYGDVDGYEIFAGDWGGCACGGCDYLTWMDLAAEYIKIIRRHNPDALVCVNTWSVAYWGRSAPGGGEGWEEVFRLEAETAWKVAEAMGRLPKGTGLTLPFHHLYRPLALNGRTPEEAPAWPDAAMVAKLREKGYPVYAWPHFVMENDPYHLGRWGNFNVRVRYIGDIVGRLHGLEVEGIVGNLYNPMQQPLSAWVLARLCREPGLSPEEILKEFAGMTASPDSAEALLRVLLYLENTDPWEEDFAPKARLRALPGGAEDREEALELLGGVAPLGGSGFMKSCAGVLEDIRAAVLSR